MKETLQIRDSKSVSSSLGWQLDILSLTAIRYTEAQRTITLEMEDRPNVTGELEWILYLPETWVWTVGDGKEPVEQKKIPEILDRIGQAFWKLDMPIRKIV